MSTRPGLQRAGMKVGPTERIGRSFAGGAGSGEAAADAGAGSGAAGVPAVAAGAAPPFFFAAGATFGCSGCDIFFALFSVTMMSPCCSAAAFSSIDFSASDQVCPAALQEQVGTNSLR